jgi:hypothetical protein
MQFDQNKLEKLVEENKLEEAKVMLDQYLNAPQTEEEKTEMYIEYTKLYLEITKKIQEQYIESLKGIVSDLEEIDSMRKDVEKEEELLNVRDSLKS